MKKEQKNLSFGAKLLLYSFSPWWEEIARAFLLSKVKETKWTKQYSETTIGRNIFLSNLDYAWNKCIEKNTELLFISDHEDAIYIETVALNILPFFRKMYIKSVMLEMREWFCSFPYERVEKYWPIIWENDVNLAIDILVKNKIRDDLVITRNSDILYAYVKLVEPEIFEQQEEVGEVVVVDPYAGIDMNDPRISLYREFELLEKEAWKKNVPEMRHTQIDGMDLTALKLALKDPSGKPFSPKWYQNEFLLWHRRFNRIVSSRWWGKTYLWSYLLTRNLFLKGYLSMVIAPDKLNYIRPLFRFLETFIWWSEDIKMGKSGSNITVKNTLTWSEILFFWVNKDPNSTRWNTADFILWEEAWFCVDAARSAAYPCLTRERFWWALNITTVNRDAPKNWFYKNYSMAKIVQRSPTSEHMTYTVDIYKNPFIWEKQRNNLLSFNAKTDPEWFAAEYLCKFSDNNTFPVDMYISIGEKFYCYDKIGSIDDLSGTTDVSFSYLFPEDFLEEWPSYYSNIIISYDCASLVHQGWVVLTSPDPTGKIITLMAQYAPVWWYRKHALYLRELCLFLSNKWFSFTVWIDYLGVGVAVSEILYIYWLNHIKLQNSLSLKSTRRNSSLPYAYKWNKLCFSKKMIQEKIAAWMNLWLLSWYSYQTDMRDEFFEYTMDSEGKTSTWATHHFDLVNSYFINLVLQLYHWTIWVWLSQEDMSLLDRGIDPNQIKMSVNKSNYAIPDYEPELF